MNIEEKIFVAGGRGMVGSAICRKLLEKGYGNPSNGGKILSPSRKDLNLLNFEELKSWFELNKPTIIIIAAAKVGGILANSSKPYDFIYENLKIETNIIEISRLFKVKKILFLGSSCIYPKFSKQPIKEEYLLESALEPTNQWYAIAKISGIKLCESLYYQYGINAISLMPCNLYGIGDNYDLSSSHVIPALINKFQNAKNNNKENVLCWGTGKPLREFLYVDDLADACIFLLENWALDKEGGGIKSLKDNLFWLNVGSGEEISIKKLAYLIANLISYEGEIIWDKSKPDGTPRKLLDSRRLRDLGWEPIIDLKSGLKLAIKDFNKTFK